MITPNLKCKNKTKVMNVVIIGLIVNALAAIDENRNCVST